MLLVGFLAFFKTYWKAFYIVSFIWVTTYYILSISNKVALEKNRVDANLSKLFLNDSTRRSNRI